MVGSGPDIAPSANTIRSMAKVRSTASARSQVGVTRNDAVPPRWRTASASDLSAIR
jgi:hypothetical protein